ncbi:MAG: SH3 domain-containing protein [Acidobacteria bacterium]|nr:SH3 domain-containing protein [Acidobacteriota bacterium]
MSFLRVTVLFVLFGLCGSALVAQERFIRPVDEASKDASFLAFRNRLITAVDKKDARYIYSIVDPRIQLSFGGDAGLATFKRVWKLERANSEFWKEFGLVIRNGGRFINEPNAPKQFAAPYTYSAWPDDLDSFEHLSIFGFDVNLRERPSTDSRVLGQLSYNVVRVDTSKSVTRKAGGRELGGFTWYYVETLGGKKGYVSADYVRSPIDLRAGFERKRGAWRMTYFIAGD